MRVVIVDRSRPDIFQLCATTFKDANDVRLLYDRRSGTDRRAAPRANGSSPGDRRGPPPESWTSMHCVVLKQDRL